MTGKGPLADSFTARAGSVPDQPVRQICFVISSLECGGAERVLSSMANYWAQPNFAKTANPANTDSSPDSTQTPNVSLPTKVSIITFADSKSSNFYPLDPAINQIALSLRRAANGPFQAIFGNVTRALALRRTIKQINPTVVISSIHRTNCLAIMATRGLGIPLIISEHSDPSRSRLGRFWSLLRRCLYRFADGFVTLTTEMQSYFREHLSVDSVVIPNPVFRQLSGSSENGSSAVKKDLNRNKFRVIAAGRLAPVKGFDLLIEAFHKAKNQDPRLSLTIWGDGPLRAELTDQIAALGLTESITLPGVTKNLERELQASDLFVLSSRHEAFPGVLLEAMAAGLPVASFNCPSGPRAIIEQDVNGIMVPAEDVPALSELLVSLASDPERCQRLGERAIGVRSIYSLANTMQNWELLLAKIAG